MVTKQLTIEMFHVSMYPSHSGDGNGYEEVKLIKGDRNGF